MPVGLLMLPMAVERGAVANIRGTSVCGSGFVPTFLVEELPILGPGLPAIGFPAEPLVLTASAGQEAVACAGGSPILDCEAADATPPDVPLLAVLIAALDVGGLAT